MEFDFKKYKILLDNLYDGVYFVNKDRKILYWNKAAEEISGYKAENVINSYCWDNILQHVDEEGIEICKDGCPLRESAQDEKIIEVSNLYMHHKDGYRIPITIKSIPIKNKKNEVEGIIEVFTNCVNKEEISKRVKELEKLAMLDELTQLPNRRYMENIINRSINDFKIFGKKFGLIFMDIDNFKSFNDLYDHCTGDLILKNISKTFSNNLRNHDLIGRWGGEEFIGIVFVDDFESLKSVAEKLRILIENTEVQKKHKILNTTISIGGSLINEYDNSKTIIKRADQLMYKSKINGKNKVTIE